MQLQPGDKFSVLLLPDNNLRESNKVSKVRTIARARTLTVLRSLDGERKGNVVQFLYESGLIADKNVGAPSKNPIVNLSGAKLEGADLKGARHNHYTLWPENFDPLSASTKKS